MEWLAQLTGYLATLLLGLSLLTSDDLRFRWLNGFGCVAFIVYGVMISAWPVVFTNALLLLINIYYLINIYRRKEAYDMLPFSWDDPLVQKFLAFYSKDIAAYFPQFSLPAHSSEQLRFLVLRDMVAANIFVVEKQGSTGIVMINYTIPRFRDYKVGKYIFEKENRVLKENGIDQLVYHKVYHGGHEKFLKRMGFRSTAGGGYQRSI